MFCFLDSCFQHEDILCDFITNLGTTILQKELVFFVHNVRCFLKQKPWGVSVEGVSLYLSPHSFPLRKFAIHCILFLLRKTVIAVENKDFFYHATAVCVAVCIFVQVETFWRYLLTHNLLYWEFKWRYREAMYITPLKHPVPLLFKEITSAGVSLERTVMICSIIGITRSLFCLIPQLKIYIQH